MRIYRLTWRGKQNRQQQVQEQAQREAQAAAATAADAKDKDLLIVIESSNCRVSSVGLQMFTSRKQATSVEELHDRLLELHDGMPGPIRTADMRLLKVSAVLSWPALRVYEEVQPGECINLPYKDVKDDTWAQTAVLSWRWAEGKPVELSPDFSPMSTDQFRELRATLQHAAETAGITHVWIDWCCVPQYSANPMVEVLRSKVFYARAHTMIVLPTFFPIPQDGVVRVLLAKAARLLKSRASHRSRVAGAVVDAMLAKEMVAGREYFGRVWTLAERLARYGRKEQLSQWLSLEAWLGMVADAMLRAVEDKGASQIYKKMLGKEASKLLDDILGPLKAARRTASMVVPESEGLGDKVAALFELVVERWVSANSLEEAPTKAWLLSYMEEASSGVYKAFSEADRVWAVYSYFCWKQLDQQSEDGLAEALNDLVEVAGGERKHLIVMAIRLGLEGRLLTEDELAALGQLLAAAERGAVGEVEALLAAGVYVDCVDRTDGGTTPLHKAVCNDRLAVVELLLHKGAAVDQRNTDGRTPLRWAAYYGRVDIIKLLVAKGANVMAEDWNGITPLHCAAMQGHVDACKELVAAGADLEHRDTRGFTPLMIAAQYGRVDVIKLLLAKGAKVTAGEDESTPLHCAAAGGHVEACKKLIAARAPLEHKDRDGFTPLLIAVSNGKADVIKLLLAKGANKGVVIKFGYTALHVAAEKGDVEACKVLLAAGCSTTTKNYLQLTPKQAAMPGSGCAELL